MWMEKKRETNEKWRNGSSSGGLYQTATRYKQNSFKSNRVLFISCVIRISCFVGDKERPQMRCRWLVGAYAIRYYTALRYNSKDRTKANEWNRVREMKIQRNARQRECDAFSLSCCCFVLFYLTTMIGIILVQSRNAINETRECGIELCVF